VTTWSEIKPVISRVRRRKQRYHTASVLLPVLVVNPLRASRVKPTHMSSNTNMYTMILEELKQLSSGGLNY